MVLAGGRREVKDIGEPLRVESRRLSKRDRRRDIRRRNHETSFVQRRSDLPSQSECQVRGVEQQQRAH